MDEQQMIEQIRKNAIRLDSHSDVDLLVEAVGDAQFVLLGESSHGTSEFYKIRAEVSKRLLTEKGFSFIAVEGDWPSCYRLNRYIKRYPGADDAARDAMGDFNRWPTWMWANEEILDLVEWLKKQNDSRAEQDKVGFYGLDMYSLWESMEEVIRYLEKAGMQQELETAKQAFACFEPFHRNEQSYGISAAFLSEHCEEEVVQLLLQLQGQRALAHAELDDREAALSAELNALVATSAERYYRSMMRGGPDSWNTRDHHMVEALHRLIDFHGTDTKVILWEHNTHIGDARATDMAADGMVNVGQLLREQHGNQVYAIGFGTHRGTVVAGSSWGDPMQTMEVPPAQANSWEDLMHRAGALDKILFLGAESPHFQQIVGHRAIGVVYFPHNENGNYVPSSMAKRYDCFVYVDQTHALHPLSREVVLV